MSDDSSAAVYELAERWIAYGPGDALSDDEQYTLRRCHHLYGWANTISAMDAIRYRYLPKRTGNDLDQWRRAFDRLLRYAHVQHAAGGDPVVVKAYALRSGIRWMRELWGPAEKSQMLHLILGCLHAGVTEDAVRAVLRPTRSIYYARIGLNELLTSADRS